MKQMLVLSAALLAASLSVPAQLPPNHRVREETATVRGDVVSQDGALGRNDLTIELVSSAGAQNGFLKAPVSSAGNFEISGVPLGQYMARLTDLYGNTIARQFVVVGEGLTNFTINLRPTTATAERPGGVISVKRLAHKPPKQALKLLDKGQKESSKGDTQKAIADLEEAVKIDPELLEAHNSLGAAYIRSREFGKAVEQFRQAVKIDPSVCIAQTNLALALMLTNQNEEAERAARRAVELDGTSPRSRYMLALAVIRQDKVTPEVMKNLAEISAAMPEALLLRAEIYARTGKVAEAKGDVASFLAKVKEGPERQKGEQLRAAIERMDTGAATAVAGAQ